MPSDLLQYFFTGFAAGVISSLMVYWIFTTTDKKNEITLPDEARLLEIIRAAKEKTALTEEEITSIVEGVSSKQDK